MARGFGSVLICTNIILMIIISIVMMRMARGLGSVLISPAGLRMLRGRRNAYPHIIIIIVVVVINIIIIIMIIIINPRDFPRPKS